MPQIKIIVALLVLIAFLGMAYALQDARHDRDEYKTQAASLQKTVEAMEKVTTAQRAAIIKLQKKERQNDDDQQRIRGKILTSPASNDAPAAPVLADTLIELRSHQGR